MYLQKMVKIKSVKKRAYKGYVHNLAVANDETFFANHILVHNCRSLLIPIMLGDGENEGDYFENYEKKFETWGTGVSKEGQKPAEGFGG